MTDSAPSPYSLQSLSAVQLLLLLGQAADNQLLDLNPIIDLASLPISWQETSKHWRVPAHEQRLQLQAWKQDDQAAFAAAHEILLGQLGTELVAGRQVVEQQWDAVFERLIALRLTTDFQRAVDLLAQAAAIPLQLALSKQRRQFYNAFVMLRSDQIDQAAERFFDLLADPSTVPYVRARTLNAQAIMARVRGDIETAQTYYQKSLAMWETIGDFYYEGVVRVNLGVLHYQLRQYEVAQSYLQAAQALFTEIQEANYLTIVNNELGLIERDHGRWSAALGYFQACIDQGRAAQNQTVLGLALLNRGEVLLFQGDLEAAEASLHEALDALNFPRYRIDVNLYLGLAAQARHANTIAVERFERALELARQIGRQEIMPTILYHLGRYYESQQEPERAYALYLEAVNLIEKGREPIEAEDLKMSLLGSRLQVYEALVLLSLALKQPEEAFLWSERARARTVTERVVAEDAAEHSPTVMTLQALLEPDQAGLITFTTGVLETDMPLWVAVPPDNPVRHYGLTPARIIRFIITADSFRADLLPLDPNALSFGAKVSGRLRLQRLLNPRFLRQLRAMLWPEFKEPIHQVTIVPHGPLHQLSFAAIVDDPQVALTFMPSSTIWAARQEARGNIVVPSNGAEALFLGYNGRDDNRRLAFALVESNHLAHKSHGRVIDLQSEEALPEILSQASMLHFACHGWFNYERPLESYLELGPERDVTAAEILTEWHLTSRLVVLSACQTGVSRILRGDEPLGLVRAFLFAGAQAVLVTQWAVDDLATFLLMDHLYDGIWAQTEANLGDLLLDAQQWLRSLTASEIAEHLERLEIRYGNPNWEDPSGSPFADPRYWAGFMLIGR